MTDEQSSDLPCPERDHGRRYGGRDCMAFKGRGWKHGRGEAPRIFSLFYESFQHVQRDRLPLHVRRAASAGDQRDSSFSGRRRRPPGGASHDEVPRHRHGDGDADDGPAVSRADFRLRPDVCGRCALPAPDRAAARDHFVLLRREADADRVPAAPDRRAAGRSVRDLLSVQSGDDRGRERRMAGLLRI